MNKILSTLVFFTVISNAVLAQQSIRKILKGQVIASTNDLGDIYIINLNTQISTTTDNNGCFSISASVGDTLVFNSVQLQQVTLTITSNDVIVVKMNPLMNPLKEVTVFQNRNINAVTLGIIPKGQKSYTPAERKLVTASSGRFNPMGLDPLLNLLSGRTAMLKKELAVETKEIALQYLATMFDEDFFIINLKIPKEFIKGFQYYIVENTSFVSALKTKNKSLATFLISELAIDYNKTIPHEK